MMFCSVLRKGRDAESYIPPSERLFFFFSSSHYPWLTSNFKGEPIFNLTTFKLGMSPLFCILLQF